MFHTPKTKNNESKGVHLTCPSPPRPNPNFANLPSSAGPMPCSSSDQKPTSALQRGPAPLLSLSSHQSSASSTSTFSSSLLASDRPSLTPATDDESFASSSIDDEQEFFLTAPGVIRPAVRYAPVAVRNNNIVNTVPQGQGHYPVIRLRPRRSSS